MILLEQAVRNIKNMEFSRFGVNMSDNFENKNSNRIKRRRCFYDFSKDYPGTRYDKSKRSSTTDELDSKRIIIKNVLAALAIILSFVLSYIIVYTVIGISHEDVDGLDAVGATVAEETYSVSDEDIIEMIRDRSAAQSQQSNNDAESTTRISETSEEETESMNIASEMSDDDISYVSE